MSSPTQPVALTPPPFARQRLTEDMLTQRTPAAHNWALEQFRGLRSDGPFVPFGVDRATVVMPGFDGGAEWGGAAVDPRSGVLYINANDIAWTGRLVANAGAAPPGEALYRDQCAVCHGFNRSGDPPEFPSLIHVEQRLTIDQLRMVLRDGRGRMPSFANLGSTSVGLIAEYLLTADDAAPAAVTERVDPRQAAEIRRELTDSEGGEGLQEMYRFTGYHKFVDPEGYPAVSPPWGTLNAIDLNSGSYLWSVPLGEYPELVNSGAAPTGTENYGGPVLTASGLVFIAATVYDRKIRAFDSRTGALLWEHPLPYAGTATPAIYSVHGQEYVVIEANGSRDRKAPKAPPMWRLPCHQLIDFMGEIGIRRCFFIPGLIRKGRCFGK